MTLFECISCFEVHDSEKEGYFVLYSVKLEPACAFWICEGCGRKIIKTKMAKMQEIK